MRSKNTANTCNTIAWLLTGTVIGSLTALLIWEKKKNHDIKLKRQQQQQQRKIRSSTTTKNNHQHCCDYINKEKRERLPELVILLRHGESEYNADNTLWRTKPDNIINLTEKGIQQAKEAGLRIENLFQSYGNNGRNNKIDININRVQMYVSPFERTLQTTWAARPFFKHRVVETLLESRIREQEFGNFSKRDSTALREEQKRVGRFWYRFATGESGADVYDRIKSWWMESILTVNERPGYDPVDAIVVITHSLSMRFVLMQLFNWSPTTFHSVWDTGLCDMYVLRKDLTKRGISPYILDMDRGDMPRSSVDLFLSFKRNIAHPNDDDEKDEKLVYTLQDYLDIPPPRRSQIGIIKRMLAEQYPELDVSDIDAISFKPSSE